jgi:hypothetical protein
VGTSGLQHLELGCLETNDKTGGNLKLLNTIWIVKITSPETLEILFKDALVPPSLPIPIPNPRDSIGTVRLFLSTSSSAYDSDSVNGDGPKCCGAICAVSEISEALCRCELPFDSENRGYSMKPFFLVRP